MQFRASVPSASRSSTPRFFAHVFNRLVEALFKTPDPKVVWKTNCYGEPYLEVYDPETEKFYWFTSEQEALIWLERQFQQFL